MKSTPNLWLLFLLFEATILKNILCFSNNYKHKQTIFIKATRLNDALRSKQQKNAKDISVAADDKNYGREYVERTRRLKNLAEELNIDPYPSTFKKRNIKLFDIKKKYAYLQNGERGTEKLYVVYGRVMAKRNNGMFLKIKDDTDNLQIYVNKNVQLMNNANEKGVGGNIDEKQNTLLKEKEKIYTEKEYTICNQKEQGSSNDDSKKTPINKNETLARKLIEVGDFICVEGYIRRALKGELTLEAKAITFLAKALLPLPDKHKGMKDVEYIYRKKYLHFLTNEKEKSKILTRFRLIQEIREYLKKKKYMEVDTPVLQLIPGGANAKSFETFLKSLNMHLYLRIAPELFLKKLIISGISEKIFELSKCFRNEGISTIHNPEFTMLEIYKAFSNYKYMIRFTEKFIKHLAKKMGIQKKHYIFQNKWKKISFIDIIQQYTSVNFLKLSFEQALQQSNLLHVTFDQDTSYLNWGLVVEQVFKKKVEPYLTEEPLILYHLPSETSPLAKTLTTNKKLSERFEVYISKIEIANGYSEEANPLAQEEKFLSQYMLTQKLKTLPKEELPKEKKNSALIETTDIKCHTSQKFGADKKKKKKNAAKRKYRL